MRSFLRDYGVHAALLAVVVLSMLQARLRFHGDAELEAMIASEDPRVQVHALHTKACRKGSALSEAEVLSMLRSDEPLVRELAMIPTLMRHGTRSLREAEISKLRERRARRRARFLLNHRIGNFDPMSLAELEEFLKGPVPMDD